MAALVRISGLKHAYATRPLFDGLSLSVEAGERIGVIGPNGAGKSTLLRIIAGHVAPDDGLVARERGLRIGFLAQVPSFADDATILSTVLESVEDPDDGRVIARAYALIAKLALDESNTSIKARTPDTPIAELSGGWRKRVALARELMREPDLLLLDEPTNHLDIESILWLEAFLGKAQCAVMTVTHDRAFLESISNRIVEIDRRNPGGVLSVQGGYDQYVAVKEQRLAASTVQEERLRNTLRREQAWLRAGVKARSTKQRARIHRAHELADTVHDLAQRNMTQQAGISFQAEGRHPKALITARGIRKSYDDHVICRAVDATIAPGECVGIMGPNGCGKTTLIQCLLQTIPCDAGEVVHAAQLVPAYFEQHRESLDAEQTVAATLAPHGDQVVYRGKALHVLSYLDRFMFTKAQSRMQVGKLSGGEQSRLLLARLMLQEGNVLVLDEPTNDLDLATLAVLEECLLEFAGAVILVTHDRSFLQRVSSQLLAFHPAGTGEVLRFEDYAQWEVWHRDALRSMERSREKSREPAVPKQQRAAQKFSYKEQREYDSIEEVIHSHEAQLESLQEESQRPEVVSDSVKLTELTQHMSALQETIDQLYARWEELEQKRSSFGARS